MSAKKYLVETEDDADEYGYGDQTKDEEAFAESQMKKRGKASSFNKSPPGGFIW